MLQILSHLGGKQLGFHILASISHWFRAAGKRGSRVSGEHQSLALYSVEYSSSSSCLGGDLQGDSQGQVLGTKVTVTGGGCMAMVKGITRDPGGALRVFPTYVS